MTVMRGTAGHKIGVKAAHLRAIEKRDQMASLVVRVPAVEYMRNSFRTDPMAFHTMLNALLHHLRRCVVLHISLPPVKFNNLL